MKTRKLYFYSAFSIIFIASSFLWMIKEDVFAEKATQIYYRDKDIEKKPISKLEEYLKTKSITTLKLTGNEKYDDSILNRFQLEIIKVKKTDDPNLVIHLKYNKKTKYEELIRSFQICKIENCRTYVPDNYDLWVIPVFKTKVKSKKRLQPK